jgi:retron-type reverse transcriptase
MKKLETTLESKLTLDLLARAHVRARRGKRRKGEVLELEQDKNAYLFMIMDALRSGTYQPSAYREFWVYDPKKRLILALPYMDRVIHQWYVEEFIKPYFVPRFIDNSYACIPGRGTHAAIFKVQKMLRAMWRQYPKGFYIMKMDISKFFNSVDRNLMFEILRRVITDPKLLNLTKIILSDGNKHDGLPIGNYTSQYFANIYLNELDQFVKRQLKVHYYVRYMDDFVILTQDKAEALRLFGEIELFLAKNLHLKLNPKSNYYPAKLGVDFAGARIFRDYRILRKRSKSKLKGIVADYETSGDFELFVRRTNSWLGHAVHMDSVRFADKYLRPKITPHLELFPRFTKSR